MLRFFLQVSADNSAVNADIIFLHRIYGAIFSAHPSWWFRKGGRIKLTIFWTEFCSSAQNTNTALSDPVCSTNNIYTHHCNFMWTNCPFSLKTCREKIVAQRTDTSPFVFMRSATFAKLSTDTCKKKLQHVAIT